MRFLLRNLVRAALFVALELLFGRFLGAIVGQLCTALGSWAVSCLVVQHAGIECVIDLLEKKRRPIVDFLLGFAVLTSPIWAGFALLHYRHPFIGIAIMLIGEFAILVWLKNLPDPKDPDSKPPSGNDGTAGPNLGAGTPAPA